MNASQVETTAPKPAPTQLALLSVGVEQATPYRMMVWPAQVSACIHASLHVWFTVSACLRV